MILTYIWHDCFVADTSRATLVFDFWKDPTVPAGSLPAFLDNIDLSKPLYVLVSHHHKDHFTKRIFEWSEKLSDIHFIISKDVAKNIRHLLNPDSIYTGIRPPEDSVTILRSGEQYEDNTLKVEAFASTDTGNSYVVTINGITIFHAGDLNAWIWKDESTEQEINKALGDYKVILNDIFEKYPSIDYAMFPVDSRIGRDYFTGASMFVRKINVAHFFPMHFGLGDTPEIQKRYERDASRLDLYANIERGEYICLQSPYSSFADPR